MLRALHEERAANATEYAIVISLIALAIILAVAGVGGALNDGYNRISNRIATALANL